MGQLHVAELFVAAFALFFVVVLIQWLRTEHKAEDLLRAHLTAEQLQSYVTQDFFIVEGQSRQRYRLNRKDGMPWPLMTFIAPAALLVSAWRFQGVVHLPGVIGSPGKILTVSHRSSGCSM